jgi:RNA polymerase sigma factor (sigma-70 family)
MRSAADVLPDEVRRLLAAVDAADREAAWSQLVEKHGALLLHVSRTIVQEQEDAMDAFTMVLEQLRADDFRRLRTYEADGRSKFTTWLVVVVQRLCLDFVRHRYGRRRPRVDGKRGRDIATMSRKQLYELVSGQFDLASIPDETGPAPDSQIRETELRGHLTHALGALNPDDRFLLKLRFEDGLTAKEIARILGCPTPFHVYRLIASVTDNLRQLLLARGVESGTP